MLGLCWHSELDSAWLTLCQQDGLVFLMGRLATSRAQESSTSKTGISHSGNLEMSLEVQQNHLQFSFAFVLNCIWGRHHSLFHAFRSLRVLSGPGQQAQQLGNSDCIRLDYNYESLWHGSPSWPRTPTMAPSGGICRAMGNEFEPATELFQLPGGGKMGSYGNGEEVRPGLVVWWSAPHLSFYSVLPADLFLSQHPSTQHEP